MKRCVGGGDIPDLPDPADHPVDPVAHGGDSDSGGRRGTRTTRLVLTAQETSDRSCEHRPAQRGVCDGSFAECRDETHCDAVRE